MQVVPESEREAFEKWWQEEEFYDVTAAAWREMIKEGADDIKTNAYIAWLARAALTHQASERQAVPETMRGWEHAFNKWYSSNYEGIHDKTTLTAMRVGFRGALASLPAAPTGRPEQWRMLAYAKLGQERDSMTPEAVATVQDFLGPLSASAEGEK